MFESDGEAMATGKPYGDGDGDCDSDCDTDTDTDPEGNRSGPTAFSLKSLQPPGT